MIRYILLGLLLIGTDVATDKLVDYQFATNQE